MWRRSMLRRCLMAPSGPLQMTTKTSMIVRSNHTFSSVGKDVPLVVVPRNIRREMRVKAKRGEASMETKVVRTTSLPTKISAGILATGFTGVLIWYVVLDESKRNKTKEVLSTTFLGYIYQYAAETIEQLVKPYTDPSKEKLLPDWPLPGMSPNVRQVPVLVVDLEDTLVHSEWSRKHGWRHAKRPGVDEFLETLCQYYEIVIFSSNPSYLVEEVVAKLDPKGCALHVLARDATRYMNGTHVKDLGNLNRDLRQVVILDDDPQAYQLQPENAIPIRPFTDGRDRSDHELKDLLPFLKALATERVNDFRLVLAEFRDEDGIIRDLPSKYGARVRSMEIQREQQKQKGFGGFIRGRLNTRPSNSSAVAPVSQ